MNAAELLDEYEILTRLLPSQHEIKERGCCSYNWRMAIIGELRAMNKQHDAEREARDHAGIGDERNGRKESVPPAAPQPATGALTNASVSLYLVDQLLSAAGYKPDSSARHNLSIAMSNIMDAMKQAAPQAPAEPVAWIDRDDLAALQVQQDNHDSDQLFYPPVSRWKCARGDVPLYLAPHSAGPAPGSVVVEADSNAVPSTLSVPRSLPK